MSETAVPGDDGRLAQATHLHDPSLARIASLPLSERAREYEALHAQLSSELEVAIGQETLR